MYNLAAKFLSIFNPSITGLSLGLKYISLSTSFKFNLSIFKYSPTNLLYSSLKSVKNLFGHSFTICTLELFPPQIYILEIMLSQRNHNLS